MVTAQPEPIGEGPVPGDDDPPSPNPPQAARNRAHPNGTARVNDCQVMWDLDAC
jgi:hypothetical protein